MQILLYIPCGIDFLCTPSNNYINRLKIIFVMKSKIITSKYCKYDSVWNKHFRRENDNSLTSSAATKSIRLYDRVVSALCLTNTPVFAISTVAMSLRPCTY